ncbi:MFS transporter [[Actinomadura] parvosata]|uniref:MFS transporter n=1 Tax=[Actinomadura] parvosata TaxID=1955412 RepID=UPI00406C7B27
MPLFVLGVTLVSFAFMFSEPSLFDLGALTPPAFAHASSASVLGSLLLAPLLGVLLDRVRRRRVVPVTLAVALALTLVAAGVAAEGVGAFVVPVMLVASAALTALWQVGEETYLPSVVGVRGRLVTANALLTALPQLGVMGMGALPALADLDGLAFVIVVAGAAACAAVAFRAVEAVEAPPPVRAGLRQEAVEAPPPPRAGFWREAAEGVRFALRDPVLRAIALCLVVTGLTGEFADDMVGLALSVLVEDMPPGEIALARMGSIYGALALGALTAVLLHRRLGAYRLAWVALLASQPFTLLVALSGVAGGWLWYMIGILVPLAGSIAATIALTSHRQAITPDRLLGRVTGTLVALAALGERAGTLLLGLPGEWLREAGENASSPLRLLPGLVLATALSMAAAVPLLRGRRHAEAASRQVEPSQP